MSRIAFVAVAIVAAGALSLAATARAQAPQPAVLVLPTPQPVPRMQVLPLPHQQASFQLEGTELTRYHFGEDARRTFLYPINGPRGRSLTRIGHPHDPVSHSHHLSVWVSHFSVDGVDFWGDRGKGRIAHQRVERYDDSNVAASLVAVNHWLNGDNEVLLEERRRIEVKPFEKGEWLLRIDLELSPTKRAITLGKTPFGMLGVRMAKTIGVHDGGGRIRNSAGGINETGVLWKPARWCDYTGYIATGESEGITLLDHVKNPNHPTIFHVRDDGWMGASLTYDAPRTLEVGETLRLCYGLYVHRGVAETRRIEMRWQEFVNDEWLATLKPPKKK